MHYVYKYNTDPYHKSLYRLGGRCNKNGEEIPATFVVCAVRYEHVYVVFW